MLEGVLREMSDIIYGMVDYFPDAKISIPIGIALAIMTYFRVRLGIFVAFLSLTILAASSFFAEGDIYQLSLERVIAGTVLGLFALFINFYLLVRTFADWG